MDEAELQQKLWINYQPKHFCQKCWCGSQRLEPWSCQRSDVSFVLEVNDRRTRPVPELFLASPVVRCCRHILNKSTGEENSLNVLIQKKFEWTMFSQVQHCCMVFGFWFVYRKWAAVHLVPGFSLLLFLSLISHPPSLPASVFGPWFMFYSGLVYNVFWASPLQERLPMAWGWRREILRTCFHQ